MQEGIGRRSQQEEGPGNAANDTGHSQRHHHPSRDVEMLAVSACARGHSHPQSDRIRRIGGDRWNAREHERWKGDKTASTRHGVKRAAQNSREEQKNIRV